MCPRAAGTAGGVATEPRLRCAEDHLERDAELWGWLSEQERTESAEGRARAAEHAAAIERFLEKPHRAPRNSEVGDPHGGPAACP